MTRFTFSSFGLILVLWLVGVCYAQPNTSPASLQAAAQRPFAKPESLRSVLQDYVAKPDGAYRWQVRQERKLGAGSIVELQMVSQMWRKVEWKHQLYLIRPSSVKPNCQHAFLFITGGRWKKELEKPADETQPVDSRALPFLAFAEQVKTPVAVLLQVPHQPLFGDKYEDEIIAYTFKQFVKTGKTDWPLLLPMVKGAVRGDGHLSAIRQEQMEPATFWLYGFGCFQTRLDDVVDFGC